MVLDCELMPWSVKAADLIREQYASVADAAGLGLARAVDALERAGEHGADTAELAHRFRDKAEMVEGYLEVVGRYNWPVDTVDDLKLAPFHLLATETAVHDDKNHGWHMGQLEELCRADELLAMTDYRVVDLGDEASCGEAITWWEDLTAAGGEGMVVKPWDFVARTGKGLVQPRHQMPGTGIPADHLRSRIHRRREPCALAATEPRGEAVPGTPGVRPRPRSPAPIRGAGTAATGARMRLRRARHGIRAGGSTVVVVVSFATVANVVMFL